jgi:hypothetical protein
MVTLLSFAAGRAVPQPDAMRWTLLAAVVAAATPSPSPPAGPSELSLRQYCSILARCGLPVPDNRCAEPLTRGVEDVEYDEARCTEPRRLFARGVRPEGDLGFRLYRFLGRRYRVVYPIEGRLELSAPRMDLLLADLPLSARLLSRLQKVDYQAEYLDPDHTRFRGRRGKGLSGEAEIVAGGARERDLAYFGHGRSQVGPWSMSGVGLVFVDYEAAGPRALAYRLHVVATPTNAFYNFLMNRGVFKSVLVGKVREILTDIAEGSQKLDAQSAMLLTDKEWSPEERAKIMLILQTR